MKYQNKLKLAMIAAIMLQGYQAIASSVAGKNLAVQAAKIAAKDAPSVISVSIPAAQAVIAQQQVRAYSQNVPKMQVPQVATALMQQAATGKQGSDTLDMAKWLAVGGLAIVADIAHDEMNKVDFEEVDKEEIPNFQQGVDYLNYKLRDANISDDFDFEMIAFELKGNSYHFMHIFFDALVTKSQNNVIHTQDVQNFLYEIRFKRNDPGFFEYYLEKLFPLWSDKEKAHHEAGHALIAALYLQDSRLVERATIIPSNIASGCVHNIRFDRSKIVEIIGYSFDLENELIQLFAGPIAQRLCYLDSKGKQLVLVNHMNEIIEFGGLSDIQSAFPIMKKMAEQQLLLEDIQLKLQGNKGLFDFEKDKDYFKRLCIKQDEIAKQAYLKTIELLKLHEKEHKKIAQVLYDEGTISGSEVYKIVGVNPRLLGFQDDRQLAPIEKYLEYR